MVPSRLRSLIRCLGALAAALAVAGAPAVHCAAMVHHRAFADGGMHHAPGPASGSHRHAPPPIHASAECCAAVPYLPALDAAAWSQAAPVVVVADAGLRPRDVPPDMVRGDHPPATAPPLFVLS